MHDVAAHLVGTARTTRFGFVVGLARARFDFHLQNARGVQRHRGTSPHETLERLRRVAARTSTPPAPLDSRLVEEVVHGEDIRRPLGLVRAYPAATLTALLRYYSGTDQVVIAKKRVHDLRLEAVDTGATVGQGKLVRGMTLALIMAMTGRGDYCSELDGAGVPDLAARSS